MGWPQFAAEGLNGEFIGLIAAPALAGPAGIPVESRTGEEWMAIRFWACLVMAVAVPGIASALPACAGAPESGSAQVERIDRSNGVLLLKDGRRLRLEGIRLPNAEADRAPATVSDHALAELGALLASRAFKVASTPPKADRYGRVRGQLFGPDGWVQLVLLERGMARVDLAPDRADCAREFYAAERKARSAGMGLWRVADYRIRSPDELESDIDTFQVVEGRVLTAQVRGGRAYLDFGRDYRTDFTVTISPGDLANFRRHDVDPRSYAGKTVRVRGIVQEYHGPEIEIASPEQIELLQ
jgi:endonuclease YncB( thermonuclease family)